MPELRNPERAWSAAVTPKTIDRAEVERRIGPTSEPIEVLNPIMRTTDDIPRRIAETLEAG